MVKLTKSMPIVKECTCTTAKGKYAAMPSSVVTPFINHRNLAKGTA